MPTLKAVYLRKRWAGRDVGTRFWVLGPNDDLKRGYVDALRAEQLLKDGLASEDKEEPAEPVVLEADDDTGEEE